MLPALPFSVDSFSGRTHPNHHSVADTYGLSERIDCRSSDDWSTQDYSKQSVATPSNGAQNSTASRDSDGSQAYSQIALGNPLDDAAL
jgi:hypothetical protein